MQAITLTFLTNATLRVEEQQSCIDTDANDNDPGIGLVLVRPLIPNTI